MTNKPFQIHEFIVLREEKLDLEAALRKDIPVKDGELDFTDYQSNMAALREVNLKIAVLVLE
jgi:hypothetical protein